MSLMSRCASFPSRFKHSLAEFDWFSPIRFRFPQTAEGTNHTSKQTNWPISFSLDSDAPSELVEVDESRDPTITAAFLSFLRAWCSHVGIYAQHFHYDSESEAEATCNCAPTNMWLTIWTRWSSKPRRGWRLRCFNYEFLSTCKWRNPEVAATSHANFARSARKLKWKVAAVADEWHPRQLPLEAVSGANPRSSFDFHESSTPSA